MSTRRCFDPQALRIRVSMSAIGSVMLIRVSRVSRRSPAALVDSGNHSLERQSAEADAAQAELPQKRARAPAALAAIVLAHREFRLPLALLDHGSTGH